MLIMMSQRFFFLLAQQVQVARRRGIALAVGAPGLLAGPCRPGIQIFKFCFRIMIVGSTGRSEFRH